MLCSFMCFEYTGSRVYGIDDSDNSVFIYDFTDTFATTCLKGSNFQQILGFRDDITAQVRK